MKRVWPVVCIVLLICCSVASAAGSFGDLLPSTPTPAPVLLTPPPAADGAGLFNGLVPATPTPVPTATPALATASSAVPEYFRSTAVTQYLGTPADDQGTVVYQGVAPERLGLFLTAMDCAKVAQLQYNVTTQTLRITPAAEAPVVVVTEQPKTQSSGYSGGGSSHWDYDDDCSVCGGLGECMNCFGEGELWCTAGCIGGRCIACDDGQVLYDFDRNGNPKYRRCSYCRNGVCKTCGGDGYVDCSYCRNGECSYCD